jgi:hypothetical protein
MRFLDDSDPTTAEERPTNVTAILANVLRRLHARACLGFNGSWQGTESLCGRPNAQIGSWPDCRNDLLSCRRARQPRPLSLGVWRQKP